MPTTVKIRRSGTASATPSALEHGEIAINYADGKVFWKNASNVITSFTFQSYALASHSHAASDITSGTLDAARLPLATTGAAGAVIVGTGLGVSSGTVSVTYGTSNTSACRGDDSRLSDTRTPTDGSVTTAKIANDAVTYAKIQNVSATDRLLGRSSAGAGDVEEITCTSFGRSLISSADAPAARTTLSVQPTASPAFTGAATFDNTGNVVPLTVTNAGTANSFVVNDASGDTTPFVIDASGRVGIGTGSPGAELEVADSSSDNDVRINLRPNGSTLSQVGASSTTTFIDSVGARSITFLTDANTRLTISSTGTATFAGQVLVTAGSGSSGSYKPGLAVSGDDDTGVMQTTSGGANTLSLVTNSTERVRFTSGGTTEVRANSGSISHLFTYNENGGEIILYDETQTAATLFDQISTDTRILELVSGSNLKLGLGGDNTTGLIQFMRAGYQEAMRIKADGEVLIGYQVDQGGYLLQVNSQIYATNATIATSDARFKTNVESLTDATSVIESLRPVAFDFIPQSDRNFATERQVGLIAQEAQAALAGTDYADSVVAQCGDHLGLAYEKLVPVLIKALQESNARIAALEERLNG